MMHSIETGSLKTLIIDLLNLQGGSGEGMSLESTEKFFKFLSYSIFRHFNTRQTIR